jgi:hypothetical protein
VQSGSAPWTSPDGSGRVTSRGFPHLGRSIEGTPVLRISQLHGRAPLLPRRGRSITIRAEFRPTAQILAASQFRPSAELVAYWNDR